MNRLTFATIAGGALTAAALGLAAGAQAAPKGIGSKVVLNKIGTGPLDRCTVDSVRPGETIPRTVHAGDEVLNQIVYLTAKC